MLILKILAFVFLVPGFAMVFGARWAVEKFNLDKSMKVTFENEMNEEEILQYKTNKAVMNLKMYGLLVALPGLVLIVIAFK